MHQFHKADIVILGAGIGGYEAFRSLAKYLKRAGLDKKVIIVDQNNYFTFVPMLHEVATGSIEPTHCAIPLRELIYKTPHQFIKARVENINPLEKIIKTSSCEIRYDYCVVALGSTVNYFGTPGAKQYSHNVRTLEAALRLKYDFIERLDSCTDHDFAINIVGGGYTGVEVAGQYSDLIDDDIKQLYPDKKVTIKVIQSGPTVLPHMSEKVQKRVQKKLTKDGVEVLTNSRVKEVKKDAVILADDTRLASDVTIWTAGFANLCPNFLDESYCERGRLVVNGQLHVPKFPSLYALGDIAIIKDPKTEIAYPQLAEAAHHEGMYVAKNITRALQDKKTDNFVFKSKGTLMPVGDWYGVAEIGPFTLFGRLAWWIRRTVYLLFMPGITRKLRIAIDWTLHSFGFRHFISIGKDCDPE